MKPHINFDTNWKTEFLNKNESNGHWDDYQLYKMAYETQKELSIKEFEGLQATKHLSELKPHKHQIETAQTVIEKMNGKAILADEVGLGKTIEAGLILKEYMIRGLVKKVLIMVPSSLVSQWVNELNQKFFIPAVPHKKSYILEQYDVVVTSIDTAKRNPHKDIIYNQDYDMIIIDEAHKLKNNKTKSYEFVKNLKKKLCLLLTATPIQNNIYEIFNLITLLKPGHLGNYEDFQKEFNAKKHSIDNDKRLKELVNKVMVRNRRVDTGIHWTKRNVKTVKVDFTNVERDLYESVSSLRQSHSDIFNNAFSTLTLQREICSSREATFYTIKKMLDKHNDNKEVTSTLSGIIDKINSVSSNSKAEKTYELIKDLNEKVIIFTEYRATQMYLQWFLQQKGISSVPFNGKFKRSKRDWMKQLFENHAQVLIATAAGGEGINLQFCNNVINYDLPWNPMKLEQRIGRVHRLGQKNDVNIFNISVNGTVEEQILDLLYTKINLFERVVGELDEILMKVEVGNIDEHILEIFQSSDSEGEIKIKLDNLQAIFNIAEKKFEEAKNHATRKYS